MPFHQKVLVIENDPALQRILFQCLNSRFSVKILDNGLDGLAYLQDGNVPAIIIADYNSPVVDGIQLIEQVRSSNCFSHVPMIILMNGKDARGERDCLEAGADHCLAKASIPAELLHVVKNRLPAMRNQLSVSGT